MAYAFVREAAAAVLVVLAVGLLLFGASGVWPPMVAVESASMEPNVHVGDLVFVVEPGRLAPDYATPGSGVVPTARRPDARPTGRSVRTAT